MKYERLRNYTCVKGVSKLLEYEIIKSGSEGNCVIIEDLMFDIGVTYKSIRDKLYDVKYIFITHRHSDHYNPVTINKVRSQFPRIEFISNYDVAQRTHIHHIVGDETELNLKGYKVRSFPCVHDVPTHGFVVEKGDVRFIYATDTHTLDHAPKLKYDYLFIESNHDENKVKAIQSDSVKRYGYDAWAGAMRHLSTQKSKAFYYMHRRSEDSKWIELHKSKRFY